MNEYNFDERLAFSTERRGKPFEDVIQDSLPGIIDVSKTDVAVDKTGIDYIATLRGGATIGIDLKLRDKGCSRYWKYGDELALETWSVLPENGQRGKCGWTLDEAKATDYTLHVFDPSDSDTVYLLPFQLLRKAFRNYYRNWLRIYRVAEQNSGQWKSQCVFVPAGIVLNVINQSSIIQHAI